MRVTIGYGDYDAGSGVEHSFVETSPLPSVASTFPDLPTIPRSAIGTPESALEASASSGTGGQADQGETAGR